MGVSAACIGIVVDTLVQLLEELSRPYKGVQTHPIHVLHSELYVVELLAECCSTHWASVNTGTRTSINNGREDDSEGSDSEQDSKGTSSRGSSRQQKRPASRNRLMGRDIGPQPLSDDLVRRLIDAVKLFSRPVPENYVLPALFILDDAFRGNPISDANAPENNPPGNGHLKDTEVSKLLLDRTDAIESYTRGIMEYISSSNWSRVLEYLKSALQQATHQPASNATQSSFVVDDDRSAVVIQELCGSFLHLRKSFQTTVAIVMPLLINRWLEHNPKEFIDLHTTRKRLDGGAETLFDMTNSMLDGGRRKALLYPFQTSLLLLLPDVFEVASNMREVKSSSISKKVSFLEMLRKALRNRNETAIFCLTGVLRVARHFPHESDAAILSYALDVQEEVREAVFRRNTPGMDTANLDTALMTATFVSLAHLNFESCVDNLAPMCLAPNTPQDFKIAVISACSHFARQSNAEEYQHLFAKVAEFVRSQLKVSHSCLRLNGHIF